jgi:hypothetical protein
LAAAAAAAAGNPGLDPRLQVKLFHTQPAYQYAFTVAHLCLPLLFLPSLGVILNQPFLQNLAAAAAAGGIGVRPGFAATGMAGMPHAATGLSLQAAFANQAAYGQSLPAT